MKQMLVTLLVSAILLPVIAQDVERKPENLTMTLARIADDPDFQNQAHVFVINGVIAYKTLDGLKNYLKTLPKGSTLTWAPGGTRFGNEPLLNSREDMDDFREFCEKVGINLTLVPSG